MELGWVCYLSPPVSSYRICLMLASVFFSFFSFWGFLKLLSEKSDISAFFREEEKNRKFLTDTC